MWISYDTTKLLGDLSDRCRIWWSDLDEQKASIGQHYDGMVIYNIPLSVTNNEINKNNVVSKCACLHYNTRRIKRTPLSKTTLVKHMILRLIGAT
jgi:hypothetical protein